MVAFVFVLTAVGQALMILMLHHDVHNYASAILPGWVVIGFGLGFTVPTIIGSATATIKPAPAGTTTAHDLSENSQSPWSAREWRLPY